MSGTYPLAALVILDGWGLSPETHGNAVRQARTPCFDSLWEGCPRATLAASGRAVGLPAGQMGNSEVGHLNLGAGRTVWQDITRIDNAIEDGSFFCNPALVAALSRPRVHLLGLVSDGGVHSSERHYLALVEMAARLGRRGAELSIHAFTDGRDTSPTGGAGYLETLLAACRRVGAGVLGTVVGRYHAMDRDRRWERIGVAVRALVAGEGEAAADPVAAVRARYARGQTDEFLDPIVVPGTPRLAAGDAAVFFNFRADRGRQLSIALGGLDEPGAIPRVPSGPVALSTLTRYREDFPFPCAFPPHYLAGTLGEVVSRAGLFQLRIAETEKYAHVTYFFNGRDEKPFEGEERALVPSPKVATYDLAPEMSAPEVTRRACDELATGRFGLMVLNYANPDMVGHTGSLPAAIRAVEAVDAGLFQVLEAVRARGGAALVTADHGNCEVMIDPATGGPHTAHTTNPVPLVLVAPGHRGARLAEGGALSGIAPTLCELLGLSPTPEMEARSLILPRRARVKLTQVRRRAVLQRKLSSARSFSAKCAAARELSRLGNETVPYLVNLLRSKDQDLRQAAVVGLAQLGEDAGEAVQALRELGHDSQLQGVVFWALGRIGPPAIAAAGDLLSTADPILQSVAVEALSRIGPGAIPQLLSALRFEPRLLEAVHGMGAQAVPALMAILEREGPIEERIAAVLCLAVFGRQASHAYNRLVALLDSQNVGLAAAATRALGNTGETRAVERILAHLGREPATMGSGRLAAPRRAPPFGRMEPRHEEFWSNSRTASPGRPTSEKQLEFARVFLREEAVLALARIGPGAIPKLVRALCRDGNPVVLEVVRAMGLPAVPALVPLLEGDSPIEERIAALFCLATLSRAADPVRDRLLGLLESREPRLACAAACALGKTGDSRIVDPLLALLDREPAVALAGLRALGTAGPQAGPQLAAWLVAAKDARLARLAQETLAQLGGPVPHLPAAISSEPGLGMEVNRELQHLYCRLPESTMQDLPDTTGIGDDACSEEIVRLAKALEDELRRVGSDALAAEGRRPRAPR